MASRATAAFLSGLGSEAKRPFAELGDLDARVERWLEAGRAAHPKLGRRVEEFLAWLGPKVQGSDAPDLAALAFVDLYLAFAALANDTAAHAALDVQVRTLLGRESRGRDTGPELDEVRQTVENIILVPEGRRRAALEGYSGRGPLGGWLRVIVVRELLRLRKAKQKGAAEGDEALAERVSPDSDPELKFLKQRYRGEFRAAFAEALKTLDERDRNLLRHHFIDNLTIDDLSERFAVHRATVARWLVKAKDEAARATRAELKRRLKLSSGDLDSLVRLVITRLELSLSPLRE